MGLNKVNPEPEGKEIKIKEDWDQELSKKGNLKLVNATALEVAEEEDTVDTLLGVP